MKLSDFDYYLPKEFIAQFPLESRDEARLLVLDRKTGSIEHRIFKDLTGYINPGDLLVLNDTKVLPSRLHGRRLTGGKVEFLLLARKSGLTFNALINPGRLKLGEKIIFDGGSITAAITAKNEVTFLAKDADAVYDLGLMPLPPYIKREPQGEDALYYQTVYARHEGAVAAPTAGLHFTQDLLSRIRQKGPDIAYITLHVGPATFKPVKSEDITGHKMEGERFVISGQAQELITEARKKKGRIFAAGTTSCRALETYALGKSQGITDLFIYPGYKFRAVDCLLTNFHLPRTTLLMLVFAFAGEDLTKRAYKEAMDQKYRFYSYGDAMLII